jgi:tetratricopeptide (TPR) repeat protein
MSRAETLLQEAADYCRTRKCDTAIRILEDYLVLKPDNSRGFYQLGYCLSGACGQHSLVDIELALECFRSALALAGDQAAPLDRARILAALGNAYCRSSRMPSGTRLQSAIACYQEAADIYLAAAKVDDWAREQNNLGLAKCDLPEDTPNKWEEAIEHFKLALFVRTEEKDPERCAATLQNLGTAYRARPAGDKCANVAKAIQCYRRAWRIYRAAALRQKTAALDNNLANAYLSLPASGQECRNRNVHRALRRFDHALRLTSESTEPLNYALTQFNRGQALLQLRDSCTPAHRHDAAICFREAKKHFEHCGQAERVAEAERVLSRLNDGILQH